MVGKKQLKQILEKVINTHGATKTAEVLDNIKAMGYKYSTRAAMTVSISDMTVPPEKPQMIKERTGYSWTGSPRNYQTWSDHRGGALQRGCRDLEGDR